jgi:hypothetical protein
MKKLSTALTTTIRWLPLFLVLSLPVTAADLAPRSDQAGGVTITVTPSAIEATASRWAFQISLDTHSGALDDDLLKNSRLIDDQGGEHAPLTWEGDPSGGHHRKGLLQFAPLKPMPTELRLRLQRTGESNPRLFIWPLK